MIVTCPNTSNSRALGTSPTVYAFQWKERIAAVSYWISRYTSVDFWEVRGIDKVSCWVQPPCSRGHGAWVSERAAKIGENNAERRALSKSSWRFTVRCDICQTRCCNFSVQRCYQLGCEAITVRQFVYLNSALYTVVAEENLSFRGLVVYSFDLEKFCWLYVSCEEKVRK